MTKQTGKKKWSLLYRCGDAARDAAIDRLARESGLSRVMATLLFNRGYRTGEEVTSFFRQDTAYLHDPFLLQDILPAVERIEKAIAEGERIAIFGDYDVDGVTSVSLLYLYLTSLGADVGYYIPSRMKEGYGVSKSALDRLQERGVSLMITVDTGITAIEEVEYAKELGIDTVVTDHHECREALPGAVAVVNPHRADDRYPFKELAGVGVVFKLVSAMELRQCRRRGESDREGIGRLCRTYADLVAIGTIADVMPIVDENRLIVTLGLRLLSKTDRPGLSALIEAASGNKGEPGKPQKTRKINSGFIGFTIAPRMNAAGRVSNASIAVELLLCEDEKTAVQLADRLCELNLQRQIEENRIAEEAYRKIEETLDPNNDRVIVIDDDTWQQGIIGIVSSRITEKYGLPSILISFDGMTDGGTSPEDIGKGSGRSIKGMNLVGALTACEELLVRFGGHELAAGLSIRRGDIDAFRRKINDYARERLSEEMLCVHLDAECEVGLSDLTMELAKEIEAMEPFGVSNPIPNFILREARVLRIIPLGNGKHTKLILEKDGEELTAVWFGASTAELDFDVSDRVDLLFRLSINEFRGTTTLQLMVQDMQISSAFSAEYALARARYEEIRGGALYSEDEAVLPNRDDIAVVYTALRQEFRAGRTVFPMRRLMSLLRMQGCESISYIKLKFIIRIMQELQICGVTEPTEDCYLFEFQYHPTKTNIEKSSILRKLRTQQQRS